MNRIKKAFENKKAFIPFITGGDPNLEVTKKLLIAMQEAGADLIEIGIPFSDPIAEGVVIQAADERALAAGCTPDKLFDMVKTVHDLCESNFCIWKKKIHETLCGMWDCGCYCTGSAV